MKFLLEYIKKKWWYILLILLGIYCNYWVWSSIFSDNSQIQNKKQITLPSS